LLVTGGIQEQQKCRAQILRTTSDGFVFFVDRTFTPDNERKPTMTTPPTATPAAAHEKENASSSKRKSNSVVRSSTGRRAVVFAPKQQQPEPPAFDPSSIGTNGTASSWLEAFRHRRQAILATADHTVQQVIEAGASEKQHQAIHHAVQQATGGAERLWRAVEEKADRVQAQIKQDGQTLDQLNGSLAELQKRNVKLDQDIDALEQEAVRLRLENMSLADQVQATANEMSTMEQRQKSRHRRAVLQIGCLQRLSGIVWNYAEIEKDSNRLVGVVVRGAMFLIDSRAAGGGSLEICSLDHSLSWKMFVLLPGIGVDFMTGRSFEESGPGV
jgi:hypothetical protein